MVENVEDAQDAVPEVPAVEVNPDLELFTNPLPAAYAWAREGKDQPPVLIKPARDNDGFLGIQIINPNSGQPEFIKGPMILSFAMLPGQERHRASQAVTIETDFDRQTGKQELGLRISPRTFNGGKNSSLAA